jgi:enoyl-CoA hydratase
MFDNLLIAREGAVALLTLNRPQSLNALNAPLLNELSQAILQVRNDSSLRAVIITGAGTRAFAAGADLKELAALPPVAMQAYAQAGQRVLDLLEQLGKPVVAAINGFALGGGCELAMACTLRIAADTARFGQPEVNLGLMPGFAGTQRLVRLIGKGRALDLLLTGRQIDAADALRIGLVDRVCPAAAVMTEARTLAGELAAKPPLAVRSILEAVHRGSETTFEAGQALEASLFGLLASTADMREGTAAFLEKRPPVFKGE